MLPLGFDPVVGDTMVGFPVGDFNIYNNIACL